MQRLQHNWFADSDPLTDWIARAKAGDENAAELLWRPCFDLLVRFAHRQMSLHLRTVADEEDVALLAFFDLWQGATQQQFTDLKNRDDLWKLLWRIALHKVVSHHRFYTRDKRRAVPAETRLLDQLPAADEATVNEMVLDLRSCLPSDLRPIAALLLAGATDVEISSQVGMSVRSLQRRFQVIERCWKQFLSPEAI